MNIPVWFPFGRGYWDDGLILAAIRGQLAPVPPGLGFTEHEREMPPPGDGVVIVTHGEQSALVCNEIDAAVAKNFRWSLLIHAGDERLISDFTAWHGKPNRRLWQQYARPYLGRVGDRNILLGWPPDTAATVAPMEKNDKRLFWCFIGQNTNAARNACCAALKEWAKKNVWAKTGVLIETEGFSRGIDRMEYLAHLCDAHIVPCPSGPESPDSYRLAEALECGCLPIIERRAPNWPPESDYFRQAFGYNGVPLPVVSDWTRLESTLIFYAEHLDALYIAQRDAAMWWAAYKLKFFNDLCEDVLELSQL